jgi:uncharacterized Zn finger protein
MQEMHQASDVYLVQEVHLSVSTIGESYPATEYGSVLVVASRRPSMRESAFTKGRRYVVEARLRVLRVENDRLEASCRGDGRVYFLGWHGGRWFCDCPSRTDQCSHLIAMRLVAVAPDSPSWTSSFAEASTRPRLNDAQHLRPTPPHQAG